MQRPPRDKSRPKSVDESTDAYDTIDWLIKNLPNNNGRVGIWGISYPGWLVTQALLDPHPGAEGCEQQRLRMTCSSMTTSTTTARSA